MSEDKISVMDCNDKYWTELLHVFQKGNTEIVPSLVKRILNFNARDENGETALHKASLLLPLELVKCFIKEGANINAKTSSGATPLLFAARSERRDVFDTLLEAGANVDYCCEDINTMLLCVSQNGWIDLLPSLVKRIPDLDARDKAGETALHQAAIYGAVDIVKYLVEEGANINAKGHKGATPLLYAALYSRKDVFNLLLCAGANVDLSDNKERLMLHHASGNGSGWMGIVQSLVKRISNLDATDKEGETALHQAVIFGAIEVVKYLVEEGANINAKGHKGATPLLYAAAHSHKDVFNLLLCAGANIDVSDRNERSVLHLVSENGSEWLDIVQYLAKRVQDLNSTDILGKTALHVAALYGHSEIVNCLVEEGAHINVRSRSGATPLFYAAKMGHKNVFDLLLYVGANVDFCENNGPTVLHYALKFGWTDKALSLVTRIHNFDAKFDGITVLHEVAYFGFLDGVRVLVKAGADINAKTSKGATPLLNAVMNRHRDTFDLLLNAGANVDGCCFYNDTVLHYASMWGWLDVVQQIVKRIPALNKGHKCGMTVLHNASFDINARNKFGETALHLACRMQNFDLVECLFQANASFEITDVYGNSPLQCLIRATETPNVKLIKLLIEGVPALLPADYDSILNSPLLKVQILQDIKFCCRFIVNKFNNHDLPKLYNLPLAGSLPRIEELKIASRSQVFQAIQRTVRFEIETEGHCIQLKKNLMALNVLCVKSVLEYYDKKYNCKFG